MKIYKPKFWDNKIGLYSIFLLPLSLIINFFIFIKKKITDVLIFNIPIICVGNIYIGGTGKTPTVILLHKLLSDLNKKPVIIRKKYSNHSDEYNLIKNYSKDLIINFERDQAIYEAINKGYKTIILDDGYQDYKINKDINILCFNQKQLIGNGLVIPAGPLRENLNSIKSADIIIINGKKDKIFEKKVYSKNKDILICYSKYQIANKKLFKNKKVIALAGIGNPKNFFDLLRENHFNIKKELSFPDHYEFKKSELTSIIKYAKKNKCRILMTEKDYFRIKKFKLKYIDYLKVNLEIKQKNKLLKRILKIYD